VAPDVSPDTVSPGTGSASASASPDTASASPDSDFSSFSSDDQRGIIRLVESDLSTLKNQKRVAKQRKNNQAEINRLTIAIKEKDNELATKKALRESTDRPARAIKRFFARHNSDQVAPSGGRRTRRHKKSRTRRRHKKSRKY
jgi:hypothetical protein